MNVEFQSEHFRLHILYSMVSSEYKNILSFFIKMEAISNTKLSEIDPKKECNFKNVDDIYLGGKAMAQLIKAPLLDENVVKRFKTYCLTFLVELSVQINVFAFFTIWVFVLLIWVFLWSCLGFRQKSHQYSLNTYKKSIPIK